MNKGFKKDLQEVPAAYRNKCRKELYSLLGVKSAPSFYRRMVGKIKLSPAEAAAVKELFAKYQNRVSA